MRMFAILLLLVAVAAIPTTAATDAAYIQPTTTTVAHARTATPNRKAKRFASITKGAAQVLADAGVKYDYNDMYEIAQSLPYRARTGYTWADHMAQGGSTDKRLLACTLAHMAGGTDGDNAQAIAAEYLKLIGSAHTTAWGAPRLHYAARNGKPGMAKGWGGGAKGSAENGHPKAFVRRTKLDGFAVQCADVKAHIANPAKCSKTCKMHVLAHDGTVLDWVRAGMPDGAAKPKRKRRSTTGNTRRQAATSSTPTADDKAAKAATEQAAIEARKAAIQAANNTEAK